MQVLFKTSYDQDISHLPYSGEKIRVGLAGLAALLAPLVLSPYLLGELGLLMVYAIAGLGLCLLTGFAGQVSFGHAAFLGIGAYIDAILMTKGLSPLVAVPSSILGASLVGAALGKSASRMRGFYLAIATLVFSVLVETVIGQSDAMTGGYAGIAVPTPRVLNLDIGTGWRQYYVDLSALVLSLLCTANLLRAPTGRTFAAIRDSEISARSLGVDVGQAKIEAFAVSAALAGLAGALLAHHFQFLTPETFGVTESLRLLLMIVVGGMGTLLGPLLGALFIMVLPPLIGELKTVLPTRISEQPGLEPLVFGIIIVLVILFEPHGLAGRWTKLRHFLETFPYYRADSFVRQKQYLKTERLR